MLEFFSLEILKLTASGECSVSVKAQGVFRLFAAFLISFLVCLMMMTGLLSAIKEDNLQKLFLFFLFLVHCLMMCLWYLLVPRAVKDSLSTKSPVHHILLISDAHNYAFPLNGLTQSSRRFAIKVDSSDMWLSIVRLIAVGILPECIIDIDTCDLSWRSGCFIVVS